MVWFNSHQLTVLTFLPLAGALAIALLPRQAEGRIRQVALGVSLAVFALAVWMFVLFSPYQPGMQFTEFRPWIDSPPISYHLGIDGLSLLLILLTAFLTPLAILASWTSITRHAKEFFLFLLALETGMIGVFASLDLFLFFVFWEVMLIPMYFLIGVWGHERRVYAAVKFILYTMVGSALMLVGILYLYNVTGSFDLEVIRRQISASTIALSGNAQILLFLAFFIAFAIKVPMFPFHTWLPDAHVEAPTAGSVILAGVLLKMGTYGMMRFCLPLFPDASRHFAPAIAVLAIIGIIYGALVAMVQPNLKRLVAYSSVSHLGFVVLGIFAFHPISEVGAIYQMLNHGVSTGALFLLVGMLYERRHTFEIAEFGGLASSMPRLAAFFLFVALSSLGLPMLNGFVGEYLILLGTYLHNWHWAAWAASGVILSAVYLLWSYQRVFFGGITHEKNRALPDTSPREKLILAAIAVVILWMGVGSAMFTRRFEASAKNVLQQMERGPGAYEATAPKLRPDPSFDGQAKMPVLPGAQISSERPGNR